MNRRASRQTAFCLIFEWSFQGGSMEELIERAVMARDLEADDFATELACRTIEHVESLDKLIEQYSEKWKLSRLSRVTLSALRLAFCELTVLKDIPLGATINEAVELVKNYSNEEEAAYVNGILGQYGRDNASDGAS